MIYDARRPHSARERSVNRWIGGNKAIAGMQMRCTALCRASLLYETAMIAASDLRCNQLFASWQLVGPGNREAALAALKQRGET